MPEVYFPDDQLMHYGVKGMRWGKRRSKKQLAKSRKKKVKSMTDDELKSRIARLELENKYMKLNNSAASQYSSKGKELAGKILSTAALAAAGSAGSILVKDFLTRNKT